MSAKRYYVYVWKDPDSGIPFYVGKGTDKRATNYHQSGRCENKRQKLLRQGFNNKDIVCIVEDNLIEQEALDLEEELIKKYKRIEEGGTLFNYKICNKSGFKILNPNLINTIISLYQKKHTAKNIGKLIGLHETSVLRYLRLNDITPYKRGSRFKFDEKEIHEIINLYLKEFSTIKISKIFKCSVPTVLDILKKNNITIRSKKDYVKIT